MLFFRKKYFGGRTDVDNRWILWYSTKKLGVETMFHTIAHKTYENSWFSALPLGNGRLGAMVYGNPERDVIEINEESLWSGKKRSLKTESSPEILDSIRNLIFENRFEEAGALCAKHLRTTPAGILSYQGFCTVTVDLFDRTPYTDYIKNLNLKSATTKVSWRRDDRNFTAESFISAEYDAWFYRISSSAPFSCAVDMTREENAYTTSMKNGTLMLRGRITWQDGKAGSGINAGEGIRFGADLSVLSDGTVQNRGKTVYVSNASYVVLVGAFITDYDSVKYDINQSIDISKELKAVLSRAMEAGWEKAYVKHIEDWKREYEKSAMTLDLPLPTVYNTTDMRLEVMKYHGQLDPAMLALYYNYGRYLLLSSSAFRAGLPANLQGIWCSGYNPPWGSDYHNNINLQMNYWPVDSANMPAAFAPFADYVKKQAENGAKTVRNLYHTRGWTTHLVSDIFGFTGTGGRAEGVFSMAGPWLSLNLWEHFEYTRSFDYLRDIYPILKGACEFVVDFLVEDKNGYLVTSPSNSPENAYYYTDEKGVRKKYTLTCGPTMDMQIARTLLERVIWAAKKLGDDPEFTSAVESVVSRLAPMKISERYGTICEWCEDYEETEPGHRHISHLFGLYPGDLISPKEPEIYGAARQSLIRRIEHGSGRTGWSRAWFVNFWARLHDAERAGDAVNCLVKDYTTHNLFDQHPPFPLFQIDGNLGGIAGIAEMLVQSHLGEIDSRVIEIFPALPANWTEGSITGLCARGGFTLDILWSACKPTKIRITSATDNQLKLLDTPVLEGFCTEKAHTFCDGVITMEMSAGETVELTFK